MSVVPKGRDRCLALGARQKELFDVLLDYLRQRVCGQKSGVRIAGRAILKGFVNSAYVRAVYSEDVGTKD